MGDKTKKNQAKFNSNEELYVLIPCHNEEHNIEFAVQDVLDVTPDLDINIKIIMIDDGSTDNTSLKINELANRHKNCFAKKNSTNQGLGTTILSMYKEIPDEAWITVLPGDNEIIFSSIKNHLAIRNNSDLVLGYFGNPVIRTSLRRLASFSFMKVVQTIYGYHYKYLNGLKLYRCSIFKGLDIVSTGHAFNAELIAKAQLRNPLIRITEAPFYARGRAAGSSKAFKLSSILNAIHDVYKGYQSVTKYRDDVIQEEANKRRL